MTLIAALATLAAAGITAAAAKRAQRRQNKYNTQAAELEYQRNLEQWSRENDYNSPSKQMERLTQAGINPVLAYQSAGTTTAASSPQFEAPENDYQAVMAPTLAQGVRDSYSSFLDTMAQYQAIELQKSQVENQNLMNERLRADLPYWNINAGNNSSILSSKADVAKHQVNIARFNEEIQEIQRNLTQNQLDISNETKGLQVEQVRNALDIARKTLLHHENQLTLDDLTIAKSRIDLANMKGDYKQNLWIHKLERKVLSGKADLRESITYMAYMALHTNGVQSSLGTLMNAVDLIQTNKGLRTPSEIYQEDIHYTDKEGKKHHQKHKFTLNPKKSK